MANSIATVQKYLTQIVEETYKLASLTTFLDTAGVQYAEGLGSSKTVNVPKLVLDGLSDYSKANGYSAGNVNLSFVAYTLTKDRGKKFNLDAVDNIDSAGVVLANLASTFVRDYVVPEVDAFRFAQYATGADTANVKAIALTKSNIVDEIDTASSVLSDAEVPEEGRILFLTPAVKALLKQKIDANRFHTSTVVNRNIEYFDSMQIVTVPSGRFNDTVTLGANGFSVPSSAKALQFVMMDKNAVLQVIKHNPARLFAPESNPDADAWTYNYRIFHDALVKENKKKGIYVCKVATE